MLRLGLALSIPATFLFTPNLFSASAPNVVLITIDTLRADHLHCYGYAQGRTPNIDKLAAEGIRFTTVVTAAPLTLPSHCSILTGTYPMFHGVRDNVGYKLDPSTETLAAILKRRGYATGAVVGSYVLDRNFGLGTGFDFYYDHFQSETGANDTINLAQLKRKGSEVMDRAMAWVRKERGHPFFLWAHLYDPHDPYDPPPPFKAQFAAHPYDGEIAYVDQQVGRLIAFLAESGLAANTLIVLTADHGESLGEHKELRHGYFIYDATLLVPLIVKPPAGSMAPRVVTQQVRSIDVAPTILRLLGLPAGKTMQGASLDGLMAGKPMDPAPDAYSESFYPRQFGWSSLASIRVRNMKYIEAPRPELYELDRDPGELNNLAAARPAVVSALQSKLAAVEQASNNADAQGKAARRLAPEEIEKLASLGYVGGTASTSRPTAEKLPDPKDNIDTFYLINRAGIEAGSGKCDSAIPILDEIIQKAPNIAAVYTMLGRCYFIQEKYEESRKVFDQLQKIDPTNEDAWFYQAACAFNLDQFDAAETGFQKVLAVNPNRAYGHKYLGFIYQAKGQPDLAIAEFQKVVELSPQDLEAHGKLGFLFASSSRLDQALPHFQKVVALSPSDGSAHYNLGIAYEKLGDKTKAAHELEQACKLDKSLCGK